MGGLQKLRTFLGRFDPYKRGEYRMRALIERDNQTIIFTSFNIYTFMKYISWTS
jgi:hypothetical protein